MSTDELLTRAVEDVIPRESADRKLQSKKKLRVYLGIDPTGSKLHLGHSVPLRKLKAFQDAGHHVIFLIGSATAMIGDPTGQNEMRKPLTKEEIQKNFETYKVQAGKILDFTKVELRYNHEWFEHFGFAEIMQLGSHFTVQQMLQRDMFKKRMSYKAECPKCKHIFPVGKKMDLEGVNTMKVECENCHHKYTVKRNQLIDEDPVSPNEFLYPLMQGYDSVQLDVDFEIGGNDQLFNMLCGRKLQKAFDKREKCILTTKLIEGIDGRKMSKTYNNCIYLEEPAIEMYSKVLSIKDDLMETYFECCTDVDAKEYKKLLKGNPKEAKMRLAREIVTLYHNAEAAEAAEKEFENVFSKGGLPEDIPEVKAKKGSSLIDLLVQEKLISSKSEARRLVEQGGIKLNDTVIDSIDALAEKGIVKVGKRKFLRIA